MMNHILLEGFRPPGVHDGRVGAQGSRVSVHARARGAGSRLMERQLPVNP